MWEVNVNQVPVSPGFAESKSVESAVQKEMRRRKMLVGFFLVLLLVPVGVVVYFLFASQAGLSTNRPLQSRPSCKER